MTERERAITNLMAVDLSGGSHEMLSSIAKAIYKPTCGGWTIGACQVLRDTLVNLLSETDAAAKGECALELPDLLRKAAKGGYAGDRGRVTLNVAQLIGCESRADLAIINALADKVEQALREAYTKGREDGFDRGFASADDWCAQHEDAMAEHGWVRLPKDANGEYINEHDKVDWRDHSGTWHKNALVVAVCSDGCYVMDGIVFHVHASDIRHHKHPTVEDVLAELLCEYDRDDFELTELIERFAAKLQLRGDE